MAEMDKQTHVLGVSNAKIAKVTTNTSSTYALDTRLDLPDLSSLEVTVTSEKKEAKAGLSTVASYTFKTAYDVKFESVKIPLDVIAAINGAEITASENSVSVTDKSTDVPITFNLECDTDYVDGEAADLHMVMYCVSGLLDVVSKSDDFWTCSFEGQGVARQKDKAFRTITINKTKTAIGADSTPAVGE